MGNGIRASPRAGSPADLESWIADLSSRHFTYSFASSHLQVPRLRVLLEIARRSAHRLAVHRAGLVGASRPGSHPLAQRAELLKTYRARWETLRWAGMTRLIPRPLWIYHFAGNVLVHIHTPRAPVIKYLRLPSGSTPAKFLQDDQLGLEHGIKTFSAYPEKNLLAVLEEWFDDGLWVTLVPTVLHVVGFSDL